MNTDEFDFYLDEKLIAQHPEEKRENARLMVVDRTTGEIEHKYFYDIVDLLNPGDVLVLNNTKVIPARLYGHREGKNEEVEVLLLENIRTNLWSCLVKPGKKMKIGTKLYFSEDFFCEVKDITESGERIIELFYKGILEEVLDKYGSMPIPPYITEELKDDSEYQTVYAKYDGSAAAPTAGLHFTDELLDEIEKKGIEIAYVTLHVGLGTFRPVKVEDVTKHKMHDEKYKIDEKASSIINKAIKENRRIVACGTTSVRTLEACFKKYGEIRPTVDSTDIFIYPGFEYKVVNALITNFHLPKSTLIMLVSAFSTKENILKAYDIAVKERYRFFSFGDAMFLR